MDIFTDTKERFKILGKKILCEHCEERFYDLGRSSVMCPNCSEHIELVKPKAVVSVLDEVSEKSDEEGDNELELPELEDDSLADKEVLIESIDEDQDSDVSGLINTSISRKSDSDSDDK